MTNLKAIAYNENLLRKLQDVLLDATDEDEYVANAIYSLIKGIAIRVVNPFDVNDPKLDFVITHLSSLWQVPAVMLDIYKDN